MPKIFVIDDDQDFLEATKMALEANGFEVDTASTSQEGIKKILSGKPDLLILDVIMDTDYEGFEVARTLREDHKLTALPIIMLSGIHSQKINPYRFAPDGEYLPIDVFLDKPIKPDMLVRTIREILGELREEPKHPL
ncbi:MAG: response regulator [Anaerolineales bacterium]|nr:response regulator [Anaerolineales bacterium]